MAGSILDLFARIGAPKQSLLDPARVAAKGHLAPRPIAGPYGSHHSRLDKGDDGCALIGLAEQLDGAAFDVIVVQGSLDSVPDALFSALNEGGRLVALVNAGPTGVAQVFEIYDGPVLVATTDETAVGASVSQIAFLAGGELVEQGPPAQVFDDPRSDRLRNFLGALRD